jgi:hypothetical protein
MMALRRVRFTDLQISKEEMVVKLIGTDVTVLYELKKTYITHAS